MDIHSQPVRAYRWVVFLLAAGYVIYNLATGNYSHFGGPFRYLTFWALLLSFFSASRMLAITERRTERNHDVTAMVTAVINAMVLYLYWKLWFTNPALVNGGSPPVWFQEYYLHLAGPLLQIFDALFIARAFRRPLPAIPWLLGVIAAYVLWSELVTGPLNSVPAGKVTSGLPYPFLNDMAFSGRMVFYLLNGVVALVILFGMAAVVWAAGRLTRGEARTQA